MSKLLLQDCLCTKDLLVTVFSFVILPFEVFSNIALFSECSDDSNLMCNLFFVSSNLILAFSVSSVVLSSSLVISLVKCGNLSVFLNTHSVHFLHQSGNSCILFLIDSLDLNMMSFFVFVNLFVEEGTGLNSVLSHAQAFSCVLISRPFDVVCVLIKQICYILFVEILQIVHLFVVV